MKKKLSVLFAGVMAMTMNAQEAVTLTVGDISLTAGSTATVNLKITSDVPVTDFCSYQFDLLLPEGVEMPYVEAENGYGYYQWDDDLEEDVFKPAYTSTMTTATHSFDVGEITGGYRFICKSGQLTPFKADKTGVLTVKLIATSEAVNGTYAITLGGIKKFSIADEDGAHSIIPSVTPGKCTIKGGSETATIPFTMTSAGWGTLILPFDADVPEGLTAYACTSSTQEGDDYRLNLEATEEMTANTPYIMAGEAKEYAFIGTPNFEQCSYTNGFLTGVYVPTAIDHGYAMQKHDGRVAFYKVNNGKSLTIPAYRCYMNDNPSGSLFYRLDGTTNVEGFLTDEPSDATLYDLQGRKLNAKPEQGLYLRDGKIYMVK